LLERSHYEIAREGVRLFSQVSPLSPHLSPPGHGKKLNDFNDVTAVTAVTACFWLDGKKREERRAEPLKNDFSLEGTCT
jgi:hypothetical protein